MVDSCVNRTRGATQVHSCAGRSLYVQASFCFVFSLFWGFSLFLGGGEVEIEWISTWGMLQKLEAVRGFAGAEDGYRQCKPEPAPDEVLREELVRLASGARWWEKSSDWLQVDHPPPHRVGSIMLTCVAMPCFLTM